jgi:predicted ArsR family transcriptional regulator
VVRRREYHDELRAGRSARRERVLRLVAASGAIGTGDVGRELGLAGGSALKDLAALEADGLVTRERARSGGGYVWRRRV